MNFLPVSTICSAKDRNKEVGTLFNLFHKCFGTSVPPDHTFYCVIILLLFPDVQRIICMNLKKYILGTPDAINPYLYRYQRDKN